ncbi:CCDC25 family protein [Sporobolomyces salmoneus]|uniref:CCDC25 family protein n=1 Tax=Sporobolomyces salmoneus TaxID=183962 RepID=UPI003180C148
MVLFYTSNVLGKDVTIYAGKDKANENLIKYATERDIWFHVDKLSSPHVYLRLPPGMDWEAIPQELANDIGQLVKAGSIQGNKVACTIIYTPASNLKKDGSYATGSVSFKNDRKVKRFHIPERVNAIVNRLGKTKVEKQVDHEYEKIEREKLEAKEKRMIANELKNNDLRIARQRKEEAEARSYTNLHKEGTDEWEDDEWNAKQKEGEFDPKDDFM